jgi:TetR/AcrR family transcriptional regulator
MEVDMGEMDVKDKILKAAEEEFAGKGLAGARIDLIAKRAKVNKAMLYYYFGNKEELYAAVLENIFSVIPAEVTKIIEAEYRDYEHLLTRFVDFYFSFLSARPNLPKIMLRELATGGKYFSQIGARLFAPVSLKASEAIGEGIRNGQLNDVDPRMTIFSIIPPVIFYFANRPMIETLLQSEGDGSLAERYKANVIKVLLHGILKEKGGRV